jgi:tRNA dimethylallyltransferase
MMENGLGEEAKGLYGLKHLNALNTVGYKELFEYFDGRLALDEAIERIKGNTRRYARKQLTWYKKDEQMKWFHPNQKENIINYILSL